MSNSILNKKQNATVIATSENTPTTQMATWIHPENIEISSDDITNKAEKISTANRWNSCATSLQYLNDGQTGSIVFKVPKKTTQRFYIGFSDGCINPLPESNIVGVTLSQNGPGGNNLMALDIFEADTHVGPMTEVVKPGDKITLTLEGQTYKIIISDRIIHTRTLPSISYTAVAKVTFIRPGYIKNVQLTGDWETTPVCNTGN